MKAYALLFSVLCQAALGCKAKVDPRSVRGCIQFATAAIDENDGERLYRVLDERSRHALISIVEDRNAARLAIETDYPEAERARAMAELGATADSPAALFATRCDETCKSRIAESLGAPQAERDEGLERVVTTTRGELRFYRPRPGAWWGFVWQLDALSSERDRASRDRRQVEQNAATYRRRAALRSGHSVVPRSDQPAVP